MTTFRGDKFAGADRGSAREGAAVSHLPFLPPSHPCSSQGLPRRGRARQPRALFRTQRRLSSPNAGQAGRRPPTHPRRDLVDGVAAGVAARLRHGVEAGQVGAALPRAQHPAAAPAAPPSRHGRKRRPGTPRPARAVPGPGPGSPARPPRDARLRGSVPAAEVRPQG